MKRVVVEKMPDAHGFFATGCAASGVCLFFPYEHGRGIYASHFHEHTLRAGSFTISTRTETGSGFVMFYFVHFPRDETNPRELAYGVIKIRVSIRRARSSCLFARVAHGTLFSIRSETRAANFPSG